MSKPTQKQLADLYHCDQPTISRLKARGVDIHDKEAVRAEILSQAKRPKAWVSGCPWDDKPEQEPVDEHAFDGGVTDDMIRQLESQAVCASDYDAARFARTKIQCLKELMQLKIQARDYVHIGEVEADYIKTGSAVKAGINSMIGILPPMLEGLSAAEMKPKLKAQGYIILQQLAEANNKEHT